MLKKPDMAAAATLAALTLGLLGTSLAYAQPQVEVEYIGGFGSYGKTQPGAFDWPVGIAIDDQGRLLIPDNGARRVRLAIGCRHRQPGPHHHFRGGQRPHPAAQPGRHLDFVWIQRA